jgi:membrane fusion protein (multidrug efflux system)
LLNSEAVLAQAQAAEMNARNNLSYTAVKSPSNGVAGILPYRQGALVSPNIPQPLTTISDNSEMYVYFSIDENQLLGLMKQHGSLDNALKNMADVSLLLSDGSRYDENGRIESVSGVIDRGTGSASVRAKFPNGKKLLHSGATGNVLMPTAYKNSIVIPQAATVQLQDKILAYKVVNGKAVSTLISVLPGNNGSEYIVQDGLNAGDIIVAEGAGMIREGMEIK